MDVSSAFLLPSPPPLPSTPVSCCSLALGVSARTLLSFAQSGYHIRVYSHPFATLCHQSFMLLLLACAEPHFSLLLTHKSTYRKIQREDMSCCVAGRPQIEIIVVAYVNLKGASKKKNPRHVILHNDLIFQLRCMWCEDSCQWFWGHTCLRPLSAPERLKVTSLRLWPCSLPVPPEAASWSNWLLSFPWRRGNCQVPNSMIFLCLLQMIKCLSTLLLSISLFSPPTSTYTCIFYRISWLKESIYSCC